MPYHHLLVAYDGSTQAKKALDAAIGLSRESGGARVTALFVLQFPRFIMGESYVKLSAEVEKQYYESAQAIIAEADSRLGGLDGSSGGSLGGDSGGTSGGDSGGSSGGSSGGGSGGTSGGSLGGGSGGSLGGGSGGTSCRGLGGGSGAVLEEGSPGQTTVRFAKANGCDLIVVGSRGLGSVKEFMLGSVSHHVVQHAEVPVLVVK